MYELQQLKSKQLPKPTATENVKKTSSFHAIHSINKGFIKANNPLSTLHHYDLASIMQEMLEMKPKTALATQNNRNQNKNIIKTNQTATQWLKPEIPIHKSNPINVLDILRNHREQSHSQDRTRQKQQSAKRKLTEIGTNINNTTETNITARSKSNYQSSTHITFETLTFPEQPRKKSLLKEIIPKIPKPEPSERLQLPSEKLQHQSSLEKTVAPRTKLNINNIDTLVSIELKKQRKKKSKRLFKAEIRKNKEKTEQSRHNYTQEEELPEEIDSKTKKNNNLEKIPDFIKASLEVYRQDTDYAIGPLVICQQVNQTAPIHQELQQPQLCPEEEHDNSEQKLTGAKVKLSEKQARRTHRIGEYIRSKQQFASEQQTQEQISILKTKRKKTSKPERLEQELNQAICGWDYNDLGISQHLDIKDQ